MNQTAGKPQLFLQQMELGPMDNYIYFIGDAKSKEIYVVDPAWDVEHIRAEAKRQDLRIKGALITHGHADHTNGIEDLLSTHDIPVYVSEHEAEFYKPVGENIKDVKLNDKLMIGNVEIEFIHTPGHTPGSQCFLVDGKLVAGDTLFLDGCGRCDMPGGDAEIMYDTIYNRLMTMPDSTIIYPGHNYHHLKCDKLEHQKKTNPYMLCKNLNEFLHHRMGL